MTLLLIIVTPQILIAEEEPQNLDFPAGKFWKQFQQAQSAHLTVIEKKNKNGNYTYSFIIHNTIPSEIEIDNFFSEWSMNIDNWGLITGDKEAASQLTCLGDHYYNRAHILKCRPDNLSIKAEDRANLETIDDIDAAQDIIEKSDIVTDLILPSSIKSNTFYFGRGHNPEDEFVIGFKWGFNGQGSVRPGESLGGFGFTMSKPLDRKKVRFWAFFDTEFPNENIQFIDEK